MALQPPGWKTIDKKRNRSQKTNKAGEERGQQGEEDGGGGRGAVEWRRRDWPMSESGQEEMADPLQARGQVRLRSVIFSFFLFLHHPCPSAVWGSGSAKGEGRAGEKLRLAWSVASTAL